ncbi:hypothetical protein CK203_019504 [Vitis vinifera]|uniref:DUF7733 domain-containing protein n=1 Tax=Vitis vinifera TaxID=29760 RepID=A0A438IYU2_VITVI|nr:hypothetical protein CK203_019504 [Vitis vinifera]
MIMNMTTRTTTNTHLRRRCEERPPPHHRPPPQTLPDVPATQRPGRHCRLLRQRNGEHRRLCIRRLLLHLHSFHLQGGLPPPPNASTQERVFDPNTSSSPSTSSSPPSSASSSPLPTSSTASWKKTNRASKQLLHTSSSYPAKRIFTIVEWLRNEIGKVDEEYGGSAGRVYIGRALAIANMVLWCFNLFGFLLPVYLPRAFKKYYASFNKIKD